MKANDAESAREALLKLADDLYEQKKKRRKPSFGSVYTLDHNRWKANAALSSQPARASG